MHQLSVLIVDSENNRYRYKIHQNGRAPVTHERQGQTLGRQGTQVHAHVDEGLEADPHAHALGHEAGDEALRQTAGRFSAIVRETDTLARVGGDEFVLLLADVDGDAEAAVLRVAQKYICLLYTSDAADE